jgi:hypothetical protein
VALSAALLLIVASHVSFWDLRTGVGLGAFAALLVAISVFLSVRLDLVTLARRRRRGKGQLLNRAGAWARLVKFVLGGVVIPIAAFVAATRVELPGHRTAMELAVRSGLGRAAPSGAQRLGDAVLRAANPAVKVEGIRALRAMGTEEALDQLLRVATGDPGAVSDGTENEELAKALASYGTAADPKLLALFDRVPPDRRRLAAGPPGDLFERYFGSAFAAAEAEVGRRQGNAAARVEALARLAAARDALRGELGRIGPEGVAGGNGLPALIMRAFLEMGPDRDPGLLAFARSTAADASWSESIRGQAMLLIAKLGSKDDLGTLYPYLDQSSPVLQAYAMRAIAELEASGATPPKE